MDDISATIAYLEAKTVGGQFFDKTPGIVSDSRIQNLATPAPTPTQTANTSVKETPYQYNAKQGNPDPAIPFIDSGGDKELEDLLEWHMNEFKKASPYYVKQFKNDMVFKAGTPPGHIDYTKDGRRIIYLYPYEEGLKQARDEFHTPAWGFYRTLAHLLGHDENPNICAPTNSTCIEIPAIEEEVNATIDAGKLSPADREKEINISWKIWKEQHYNYIEK